MQKRSSLAINQAVIFALLLREMRTRFGQRRMGAFWLFFEPIAHVAAVMLIVTVLRGRHLVGFDYPVYLLSGMIPFFLMRNIALKLMDSIAANRGLFAYPSIKLFDTYVARLLVECTLNAFVFAFFCWAMWWFLDYDTRIHQPIAFLYALLIGIVLSFGVGLILSVVAEAMPNSKTFIRLLFIPLYLISGVIVPVWNLPKEYLHWIIWNPWLHVINGVREGFFEHYPSRVELNMEYPTAVAVFMFLLGLALYHLRKRELLAL